mgnify:CR=1 FL=1
MIKFTGDLRCDFAKATAEIAKLKDRILGYQEEIASLRRSVKSLQKSKDSDKKRYQESLSEKDAVIKELQNRLAHAEALLNHDGSNTGTPTSQTPINKNKLIPNSRRSSGKPKGGQVGHEKSSLKEPDESEVTETIEKYDLVALPVIDSIGRLVGRITIDDVMDEVREQHERDYQLASGISQDVETSDNVFTQTAARLPWLLIGMIGGIGNSLILGNFEGNFAVNPKMALFIPLIGGTGGNVGIQSSAIVVQGLANNSLKEGNILPQILKESVVSLINASIISLVVFIYNFFMLGDRGITASVSLSLFAVVMFASVFGTLVPMTLDKLKIDPALATGPFITITNDIIGMMIYMFITSALAG